MSRFILGNCVDIMSGFPERAVDFILTDPPYLVGFRTRSRLCEIRLKDGNREVAASLAYESNGK
jgi:DNA modification methylase